jgi:hypothetical protein
VHVQGVIEAEKPSSQPTKPTVPSADITPTVAAVTHTPLSVSLSSKQQQSLPTQQQQQQQPSLPPASSNRILPSNVVVVQQQQQPSPPAAAQLSSKVVQQAHGSTKVPARGAVALPGSAESHFFLSHSQSTGGDQTNAIYLELQQLGFTCWYTYAGSAYR